MNRKRFKCAVLLGFVLLAMSITVNAAEQHTEEDPLVVQQEETDGESFLPPSQILEELQEDVKGEIKIHLTDGGAETIKKGIPFECILVAKINNGSYELTEPFATSGVELNEIVNSDQLSEAAQRLAGVEAYGKTGITDQNGDLDFLDLSAGVYLIKADETVSFDIILPSIVAIPTWNESTGKMAYQVFMEPKHNPRPKETITSAPQTSLQDDTVYYLIGGLLCITGSGILAFAGAWNRRKKDDEKSL